MVDIEAETKTMKDLALGIEALLTYDFDALSPQQGFFDLMINKYFLTDDLDMQQGTQFFEVSYGNETNQIKMPVKNPTE